MNERKQSPSPGETHIEERLLEDKETGQNAIVEAAQEGFVEDQKDPSHPTRIQREAGVENPAHAPASTREGPGKHNFDPQR